jgi:hypothetical protein
MKSGFLPDREKVKKFHAPRPSVLSSGRTSYLYGCGATAPEPTGRRGGTQPGGGAVPPRGLGPGGVFLRSLTSSALAELLLRRWLAATIFPGCAPPPYGPGDILRCCWGRSARGVPAIGPGESGRGVWL